MIRRNFLTSLFISPLAVALEDNYEEYEFVLRNLPQETVKDISLGDSFNRRFMGIIHKVTVTRIDQCGDRATIYAKCEY